MSRKKLINIIRVVLLITAFLFMALGLRSRGFTDMKNKAVRICYECMGIG